LTNALLGLGIVASPLRSSPAAGAAKAQLAASAQVAATALRGGARCCGLILIFHLRDDPRAAVVAGGYTGTGLGHAAHAHRSRTSRAGARRPATHPRGCADRITTRAPIG